MEARSDKIPGKGKGKEKVVAEPEAEEEEEEVESEKGDMEESPHVHAQRRWTEWLDLDKMSVTKYDICNGNGGGTVEDAESSGRNVRDVGEDGGVDGEDGENVREVGQGGD